MSSMDLTVIINFYPDSQDRVDNLYFVGSWIRQYIPYEKLILISSGDRGRIPSGILEDERTTSIHVNTDSLVPNGRAVNIALPLVDTPLCVRWDTDTLVSRKQVTQALAVVSRGVAGCIPYTSFNYVRRKGAYEALRGVGGDVYKALKDLTVSHRIDAGFGGGIFVHSTKALKHVRGYREAYTTWGYEDLEISARTIKVFGEGAVKTVSGPLIHINHARSRESNGESPDLLLNRLDHFRTLKMDQEQVLKKFGITDLPGEALDPLKFDPVLAELTGDLADNLLAAEPSPGSAISY